MFWKVEDNGKTTLRMRERLPLTKEHWLLRLKRDGDLQKGKPGRGLYGMSVPGGGNSSMFPGLEARESMLSENVSSGWSLRLVMCRLTAKGL